MAGEADGLDAAHRPQSIEQLVVESGDAAVALVALAGRRQVERDDPLGADPCVTLLQQDQVLDEEPGANQQRECHGDLRDHQSVSKCRSTFAAGSCIAFANGAGQLARPHAGERCNLRSAPDRVMLPEIGAIWRTPVPRTLLSVPESGLGGRVCRRCARVLGPLTRGSFHSQKMAPALL